MKKDIAVIEGGFSNEKIVSEKSAKTVYNHIDRERFNPYRVVIDEAKWVVILDDEELPIDKNDFSFQHGPAKVKFDFAFIVIHGTPGEDGILQSYFELVNIPYGTSDHLISALTFNKFVCNKYLEGFGVRIPESILISEDKEKDVERIAKELGFPCFIKPVDGGSSFGVSKVKSYEQILPAIEEALKHGSQVVAEKMINGIEVTNGVYKQKGGIKVLPITEIVTENEFFDYKAKYNGESQEITPARLSDDVTKLVKATTKRIYSLLGMDGIARVDYIIEDDLPYLIEINTVPGQSDESIIPQMAKEEGISLFELFNDVIDVTLNTK